ncbi:hypothetical protein V7S43_000674 [Phytophthora oleae]|uniref:PiggyBac transposable element-derived protein domain-containing protein n=1 Tax=Phytophthora oleae TaxID=2107226 RepID=A0ABD3G7Z0_9STRA
MDEIVPESDLSDDDTEVHKRSRTMEAAVPRKRHRTDLIHPNVWFRKTVADALWMPTSTAAVPKLRRPRNRRARRVRSKKRKKR